MLEKVVVRRKSGVTSATGLCFVKEKNEYERRQGESEQNVPTLEGSKVNFFFLFSLAPVIALPNHSRGLDNFGPARSDKRTRLQPI